MKYRIQSAKKKSEHRTEERHVLLCRRARDEKNAYSECDPIDFGRLFEIADLPDIPPVKPNFRNPFVTAFVFLYEFFLRIKKVCKAWARSIADGLKALRKGRKPKTKAKPETVYLLAGALCSSFLATLLCAAVVLLSLLGSYGGAYRTITIPDFVGRKYDAPLENENTLLSYVVDYVYNPDVTEGNVISQSPPAGVARRVYGRDGHCIVTLIVSQHDTPYTLPDLVGYSRRDAILELRNHNLSYDFKEAYSDTVPAGHVLSVSHGVGSILSDGDAVTLTVSLGSPVLLSSVPSMVGLSEMQALSLLKSAGLLPGKTTYISSEKAAGTVLSQEHALGTMLATGSTVALTVSAGNAYAPKTVPSLYGLTQKEAESTLRAYGLALGNVSVVGNTGKTPTVVTQSPIPGTPITSSVVSVDIFVSS